MKKGAHTGIPTPGEPFTTVLRDAAYQYCHYPAYKPLIMSAKFDIGDDLRRLFDFHFHLTVSPVVDVFTPTEPFSPCIGRAYTEQIPMAGRRVIAVFEAQAPKLLAEYPFHELHPVLDTIASALPGFDRGVGPRVLAPDASGSYAASIQAALTQLQVLQRALLQPELTEKVKTFERTYQNRRRAVHDFIEGALLACSKVTFTHLILGSRIPWLEPTHPDCHVPTLERFHSQVTVFSERRNRFVALLQRRLGKSLLGYVWRIDHCPSQGLQLSLLLGVNGHRHPLESALASQVGNLWLASGASPQDSHWCQRVSPLTRGLEHDQMGRRTEPGLPFADQVVSQRFCLADCFFKLKLPKGILGFRKYLKATKPDRLPMCSD
jgi:hypothetical protein